MAIHPYTRLFILPSAPTVDEDITTGYEVGDVVFAGGSIYDCMDNADGAADWQEREAAGAFPNPFALTSDISVTLAGNVNDWNPTGLSTADVIKITPDPSDRTITGIAGGTDGRILILMNMGGNQITLKNNSTASSAANRFSVNGDKVISGGGGVFALMYDGTASRWKQLTSVPSAGTGNPLAVAIGGPASPGSGPTYSPEDHVHALSLEAFQDAVGAMIGSVTGITVTYDDTNGVITFVISDEYIQDLIGAMISGNTETGIDVTYDDSGGKLNFDAQTAGDARYAPIAKGVTNGDSHDHNGGDGAQIAYSSLSGALIQAAGTYSPTLANVANIDSSSLAGTVKYSRIGNVGHVAGTVNIDPTSAGVTTDLGIPLPIASNFTAAEDCAGMAGSQGTDEVANILGDATNDRAILRFTAGGTTQITFRFVFMYEVK